MHKLALIGKSLTHSFSQNYFKQKFGDEGINNLQYVSQELPSIDDLPSWLRANEDVVGFNVTIPYKQEVCLYVDELFGPAAGLKIVNTVVVERNIPDFLGQKIPGMKLKGFNTDIYGFKESIKPLMRPWFERALILGTGASSGSIAYVLYKLGVDTLFVSRNPQGEQEIGYEDLNEHVINFHPLIINTSPVGQYPQKDELIPLPYEYLTDKHLLYDLIYNPEETRFLEEGRKKGTMTHNGYSMLKMQADQSLKTWQNSLGI